jgi:hypothetical protein
MTVFAMIYVPLYNSPLAAAFDLGAQVLDPNS